MPRNISSLLSDFPDFVDNWKFYLAECLSKEKAVTTVLFEKFGILGAKQGSANQARLLKKLKENKDFCEFYNSREQELIRKKNLVEKGEFYSEEAKSRRDSYYAELSKSSEIVTYTTPEGDFTLPAQWKELLGKDCLDFKVSVNARLKALGLWASRESIKIRLRKISEFKEWQDVTKQKMLGSLEKYGVRSFLALPEGREKARQAFFEKYKRSNIFSFSRQQMLQRLRNFGIVPEGEIPETTKEGVIYKGRCLSCGNIFDYKFTSEAYPTVCPLCNKKSTILERNLTQWLISLGFNVSPHDYSVLGSKEIDIYLPDLKIGFELNGAFSHNSGLNYSILRHNKNATIEELKQGVKSPSYHRDKSEEAKGKGVLLYHLWEHWGEVKIKSLIKAKLGIFDRKVYARDCEVVLNPEALPLSKFYEANHVLGTTIPTFTIALQHKGELVQAASFKRLSCNEFTITRNASLEGVSVIGGFARIMYYAEAHIRKNYAETKHIVTYADRDITPDPLNCVYSRNGFSFVEDSGPTLKYYVQQSVYLTSGERLCPGVYNRQNFMKHKLAKFEGAKSKFTDNFHFNATKTEQQLLEELAIVPVYNSGCWKFIKHL